MLSTLSIAAIYVGCATLLLAVGFVLSLLYDGEGGIIACSVFGIVGLIATIVTSIMGGLADHPKVFSEVQIKTLTLREETTHETSSSLVGGLIGPFILGKVSKTECNRTTYYYVFWRELENEIGSYKLETIECEKTYIKPYTFTETSEYKRPTMVTARSRGDYEKHYTLVVPEEVSYKIFTSFDELSLMSY